MKVVELTMKMRVYYHADRFDYLDDALSDIESAIQEGLGNYSCCSDYEYAISEENLTDDGYDDEEDDEEEDDE